MTTDLLRIRRGPPLAWLTLAGLLAMVVPEPSWAQSEPAGRVPAAAAAEASSADAQRRDAGTPAANPKPVVLQVAPAEWRRTYYCGVNCLYVLLRMLGTQVSHERLCREASVGPQGTTMAELARLARVYGLSLTPMRADRESISRWPLPAIVHQRSERNSAGHYILLLGREEGRYATLDCTTGQILRQREGDFLAKWSGYVMLRSRPSGFPPHGWAPYLWVTVCLWMLAYGVFRWLQVHARRPARSCPSL